MSTPYNRLPRAHGSCRATMPGRLGRPAALLAAIVLFLAALPILTMILMSFSAPDTLEFPPPGYSLQWYRAAWHSFVSPDASDVAVHGHRADDEPDRRGIDDDHRDAGLGARRVCVEPLPLSRQVGRRTARCVAARLSAGDARVVAAAGLQRAAGRTRRVPAHHRARDSRAAVHGEKLRGVGGVDRPGVRGSRVRDGCEPAPRACSTWCCR